MGKKNDTFHVAKLRPDGKTDNFFGPSSTKNNKSHGHIVAKQDGGLSYVRDVGKGGKRGEVLRDDRKGGRK